MNLSFNSFRGIFLQSDICSIIQQGLDLLVIIYTVHHHGGITFVRRNDNYGFILLECL